MLCNSIRFVTKDMKADSQKRTHNTKNPLDNYFLHPVEVNNEQKHVA